MFGRARREARVWRNDPPRQRRFTEPACALGAVLQRLTIDAVTSAEVQTCLRAVRAGFAAEGLVLTLPSDPVVVAALGPRLTPEVLDRLRRLACPTSAAALMLALATDAEARSVASCSAYWISPTAWRRRRRAQPGRPDEITRPGSCRLTRALPFLPCKPLRPSTLILVAPGAMLVQTRHEVAARYGGVRGTPAAVLIDTRGRIAARPANGAGEIRELLADPAPAHT